MTGSATRDCFEPGGFFYEFLDGKCRKLPPNVACVQLGCGRTGQEHRDVTWDEVMQQRRARQAERLERIRQPEIPAFLPCYVWTFFNRQEVPYHGWYCYVVTRLHGHIAVNFRNWEWKDHWQLAMSIMNEFPCGMLAMKENFEAWMPDFAKKYPRRKAAFTNGHRDPRKAGVAFGWLTNQRIFSIHHP